MAKIVKCPSCQEKIDVTDLSGGSTVQCEACGTMVRLSSGATGRVPPASAAPPPPPPEPAPARRERGTTKMRQKDKGTGVREKGTGVRTNPGRQTDLFRKMSNARAPGEGGRPRGGGGEKVHKGNNTGMIIAIAAAAIVILGGVAFAVLHKSEPEHPKASTSKDRDSEKNTGSKKKKKDDAPKTSLAPTPPPPSDTGVFKPGARGMIDKATTPPMPNINAETRGQFEAVVATKPADIVAEDYRWITYIIDGMLSDTESVAKGCMDAMHQIITKRKLDASQSDLARSASIGGFNMPEMRSSEYTYWAQWYFTVQARNAVASWRESSGGSSGGGDAPPRVAAGNASTENWRDTLMKCRSGGFSNSSNPEYYEFQRIKGMGKAAYPHLVGFIDDDELGTTAVLILKELSGRTDAPGRVTPANKAAIKADWEGWLRSGP